MKVRSNSLPIVIVLVVVGVLAGFFCRGASSQNTPSASIGSAPNSAGQGAVIDILPQQTVGHIVKYNMVYDFGRKTATLIRINTDEDAHVTDVIVEKVINYTQPTKP